ncbi:polyprenyl synthetase family protein [Enterococcus sp. CWB-B31]|uniref:polyprenyl synthetase family protein n=1 Tax=Enterococcus sp. CWB-B31 TaxID=2885159 RepID=UPI001E421D5A|nr:polyprenyl synthetase family protein [Enterococcus sp. CWB-B31]MCB5954598.1 polyprenyl synthetase family protein [Enterococcus sp. CWB-B31]
MNTKLSALIFSKLEANTTIKKYNELLTINILEIMNYKKKMSYFSWGVYYAHISKLSNSQKTDDLKVLYSIELLGLSARLIDDALDKDSLLFERMTTEYLFLLSTELIVESLDQLCHQPYWDYSYLNSALNAERIDYSTTLNSNNISIDFYFENIIPKSTASFQLFTKMASHNNEQLNLFSIHFGTYLQIKNDLLGFWEDDSFDIHNLKCTLPLLTGIQTLHQKKNDALVTLLNSSSDLELIRKKIVETGAIRFCSDLMHEEKNKASAILTHFKDQPYFNELKNYLRLE